MRLGFSLMLFLWTMFPTFAGDVVITVDSGDEKGPVNELVFGHNLEAGDSRGLFSLPADAPEPRTFEVGYAQGYWDPVNQRPAPGVVQLMKQFRFGVLRYPGGCLAHNFRWKETIGPMAERGSENWYFGLDEFLQLCSALKCEPQIIVTDYGLDSSLIPQDAADLVEYLNMPADPAYPWAMKRAANGHPAPYGVKYFEIGNESSHGNHGNKPFRRYSEVEYADYFNSTVRAMKAVDPSIKTGYVLDGPSTAWDKYIVKHCSELADFAIVHSYYPRTDSLDPKNAFLAVMAGGPQFDQLLEEFRQRIREGGRELPIALTEFNMSSISGRPDAMRFSFLAGMQNAETLCKLIDPEENILLANYWFILNAMYGIVTTIPDSTAIAPDYDGTLVSRKAASRFFMALKKFTGSEVIGCQVISSPSFEAPSFAGILASRGEKSEPEGEPVPVALEKYDFSSFSRFGNQLQIAGSAVGCDLTATLCDFDREAYPAFAVVPRPKEIPRGRAWVAVVDFEARFLPDGESTGTASVGFGLMDSRGWEATRCASAVYGLNKFREWTKFSLPLQLLDDSERVNLLLRFEHVNGRLSGKLELRNLSVKVKASGCFPAYPGVTAYATKSADGKKLFVIAFNRSYDQTIPVDIRLSGFKASVADIEELYQDNVAIVKDFAIAEKQREVTGDAFRYALPPHSMTAFEFQ